MTGDEILDAMEHIDADLIEAANATQKNKHTRPYWFAAVAAVLLILIGISLLAGDNIIPTGSTEPIQVGSSPTTHLPDGPQMSQPSNINFHSVAQLEELFAAAAESQQALDLFLKNKITYYGTDFSTQEDVLKFKSLLCTTFLPCRNDYDQASFSLYYYPKNGWIEIFCDVNEVRYCFISLPYAAWDPDGTEATSVTLDGITADLREGSYLNSRRLFATFYIDQQVISMWAYTTNPDEVDLSGFYWGHLID